MTAPKKAPKNTRAPSSLRKNTDHHEIQNDGSQSDVHDEEHMMNGDKKKSAPSSNTSHLQQFTGKHIVGAILLIVAGFLFWDAFITPPEERLFRKDSIDQFLTWVESHPYLGIGAFLIVIAAGVITMVPIGTPMTVGCGYIYKGVYGWTTGIVVATIVTMAGSAIGAVTCFLLGRFLMRDRVRKWIRKYPLFDAIDTAAAEHGLRIMAMLYLTPVLPLGPVSYMCGTTSMALTSFVLAKVASLPLMLLYVFVGASTGTLLSTTGGEGEAEKLEKNKTLIVSGIVLSAVMITLISKYIRKEFDKILEQQKQEKGKEDPEGDRPHKTTEEAVEMGMAVARQRRLRSTANEAEALLDGEVR